MRVEVLYFAGLRQALGLSRETVSLPAGASVAALHRLLEEKHPPLVPWRDRIRVAVNEAFAVPETPLSNGDTVALLPPLSGGAPRAWIVEEPIDPLALLAGAAADGSGACVTFTGIVRPTEKGERIAALEYEIYPGMAERQLDAVCAETMRRFPIQDVRIVHRCGNVPAGAAAVAIAVWSERREAAFDACRFAIERLKEIVPIWKTVPEGERKSPAC